MTSWLIPIFSTNSNVFYAIFTRHQNTFTVSLVDEINGLKPIPQGWFVIFKTYNLVRQFNVTDANTTIQKNFSPNEKCVVGAIQSVFFHFLG